MKLLDRKNYYKVQLPLSRVTINNLFARSVIDQKIDGLVYVDNSENPKTFYITHPYGMSLLFGETTNDNFNSELVKHALNKFNSRIKTEWLQAFPETWNKKLEGLFGNNLVKAIDNNSSDSNKKIEENTRVNFRFNKEKYLDSSKVKNNIGFKIIRTDKEIFENMQGSVVPKYFWNNAEEFIKGGVGFSLIYEGDVVATAYSAFIFDKQLEIGIETKAGFQGKSFGFYVCQALIDYCIENDLEPIWACRLENTGSFKLAQKLGFEPAIYIPYYRLIS